MTDSREIDMVLLVADLSGYMALTEAHGNVSAAKVVNRYTEIARESLYEGTRPIERVGDEILITGTDAAGIIKTALKLVHKIECSVNLCLITLEFKRPLLLEAYPIRNIVNQFPVADHLVGWKVPVGITDGY